MKAKKPSVCRNLSDRQGWEVIVLAPVEDAGAARHLAFELEDFMASHEGETYARLGHSMGDLLRETSQGYARRVVLNVHTYG